MLKKINLDTHIMIRNNFDREQIIKILYNSNDEAQFLEKIKKKIRQMNVNETFISLGGFIKQITKKNDLEILKIIKNELEKQDIKNEKLKYMLEADYKISSVILNNFYTNQIKINNFCILGNVIFLNDKKFAPLKNISEEQKNDLLNKLNQINEDSGKYFLKDFFDYLDERKMDETFLILGEYNKLKIKPEELEDIIIYSNPNLNTKHIDNVLNTANIVDIDIEQVGEMVSYLVEEELKQQNREEYLNNYYQKR